MFNKIELNILQQTLLENISRDIEALHDINVSQEDKKTLEPKIIQSISIYQKIVNVLPPDTCKNVPLKPYTPVLVIEDSIVDREMNKGLLEQLGFTHVLQAKEGQEGLAIMKKQAKDGMPVGLVLCDWNMPNMSGIEFLKVIRKDKEFYLTPVYLVTGNHDKAHIITSIKSGVTGYVVKPVSVEGLQSKIKAYLPKTAAKQEVTPAPAPE